MRFAVLMKGILRGMGREAACELLATKTVLPEARTPVYSHCAIIDAPSDLIDGDYEVEFSSEVAIVRLQKGSWLVGRVMPRTYEEAASFFASEASRIAANLRRTSEGTLAMSASRKARGDR
jgi:hypothetical protein